MWTRSEIKSRAKAALRANYWKAVFVALLAVIILGGIGGVGATAGSSATVTFSSTAVAPATGPNAHVSEGDPSTLIIENGTTYMEIDGNEEYGEDDLGQLLDDISTVTGYEVVEDGNGNGVITVTSNFLDDQTIQNIVEMVRQLLPIVLLVALLIVVIAVLFDVFVVNPFEIGLARFFLRDLEDPAEVAEIAYGYDHNYKQTVKVLFFRDLKLFLWSLLLIVPGIIKAYEYRMIPYLMADNDELTSDDAFAISKEMMRGNKWKAFVLDLSFIGWDLLSALTLGILSLFYVNPYKRLTNAALYEELRGPVASKGQGAHFGGASQGDAPVLPTV